jgi:hypothetical protein
MADFNIFDHLSRQGGGFGGSAAKTGPSDGTNEKDIVDGVVLSGVEKSPGTVAKLTGIPVNLNEFGQVGLQKAIGGDTEGLAGKMILQGGLLSDAPGGFLAKLLHDIFIKNREVTDHTGGVSGSDSGGGGGGDFSSGGGDFSGDFIGAQSSNMNFGDFASASSSYDWSDVSWASLGSLPRPTLPDMGPSGPDMGVA